MATGAFDLPPGVLLVADIFELSRIADEDVKELQMPRKPEWASWAWKKTDISAGVGVAVTASRQVLGGDARAFCGWSIAETTNVSTAAVRFHDGSGTGGEILSRINLAINESNREYFTPHGLECFTGKIYLEVISGSVEGVIFWR